MCACVHGCYVRGCIHMGVTIPIHNNYYVTHVCIIIRRIDALL